MDPESYDRWYETPRGQWIGRIETTLILEALEPRDGESLLDVGCGTGYFARALGRAIGGSVTGVDVDPARIAYARSKDLSDASYVLADARDLPFPNRSFDLVVSVTAVSFIREQEQAVREMVRVARRRVAVGLLHRRSLLWLQQGRGRKGGGYHGAQWHTPREARALFDHLPVRVVSLKTGIQIPNAGRLAASIERCWPSSMHTGAFLLVVADVTERGGSPASV